MTTHGFQQQNQTGSFQLPKSAATQQHGEKPTKRITKGKKPRSVEPRPGH
ncbi:MULTISPECIES: hypothetical protein [Phenylobacterium]|uniref:Uncharacterized protein n=1 Tax=Phenylobacterium koreense TaxID=266125 RepID=A0ABV2EMP7_9CAUL